MPLLVHRAARGDWTTFGRVVAGTAINAFHAPATGTYLAVTCSESVPFINDNEIARETGGTFMGDYRIRVHRQACREWPRGEIPAVYFEPVKSPVPVLMLSGELDGATPAQLGADASRSLSNSRQILLRNSAHGYASDCVKGIIAQFIAKGSAQELESPAPINCAVHHSHENCRRAISDRKATLLKTTSSPMPLSAAVTGFPSCGTRTPSPPLSGRGPI